MATPTQHQHNFSYLDLPDHRQRMRLVAEMINTHVDAKRGAVLSIGSGNGQIERSFQPYTVCFDKFPTTPFLANNLVIGDFDNIGSFFKGQKFDAIFCGEFLEHLYDVHSAIKNMSSLLKPSGYLIITVPNAIPLRDRVRALFGILPRQLHGYGPYPHLIEHIRHFSKASLVNLLNQHGYMVCRVATPNIAYSPFGKSSKNFEWIGVPDFLAGLGNNLVILAKRQTA